MSQKYKWKRVIRTKPRRDGRKPSGFLTRKKGTAAQKGTRFPVFNGKAKRMRPNLMKRATPFAGTPFARAEERVPVTAAETPILVASQLKASEELHARIVEAKVMAAKGTQFSVNKAITMLERKLGIRAGGGAGQVAFGPSRESISLLLAHDPLFISTRQSVLNARYAWNKSRAAYAVAQKQLILDEAVRAILDISVPSIKELRIRYPAVPTKRTAEQMARERMEQQFAVRRARERATQEWEKIKKKVRGLELGEFLVPEKVRKAIKEKLKKKVPEKKVPAKKVPEVEEPEKPLTWKEKREREKEIKERELAFRAEDKPFEESLEQWLKRRKNEVKNAVKKEKKEEKEVGLKINYEAVGVEEE